MVRRCFQCGKSPSLVIQRGLRPIYQLECCDVCVVRTSEQEATDEWNQIQEEAERIAAMRDEEPEPSDVEIIRGHLLDAIEDCAEKLAEGRNVVEFTNLASTLSKLARSYADLRDC